MKQTEEINRLAILINKIAVDRENMALVNEIITKLAVKCNVLETSVRRWLRNQSQPAAKDLSKIILCLNGYDPSISFSDYFVPNGTKEPVTPRFKLVK